MILTKKFRQKKYCAWLTLALLIWPYHPKLSAFLIDSNIEMLTHEEKSQIKYFFEKAIKIDHLGHVLFFSTKPACFFIIDNKESEWSAAWRTWQSKEPLFPHPNFIIYEEVFKNKIYVYFINKQTLLSQFSTREEILKQILGQSFSIKDFITKLEQKTFPSLIHKNHILSGILLGYGLESPQEYVKYIALDQQSTKEMKGIHCAQEGKIEITQSEDGVTFCTFNSKVPVHPISFVGDPDSAEVRNLEKIYSQELEMIEKIYQRRDLLDICLKKLCD